MQAIEFQTTAHRHTIRIPDTVPDGTMLRVLLLLDDTIPANDGATGQHWKALLAAMPDVGTDEDFSRPLDYASQRYIPLSQAKPNVDPAPQNQYPVCSLSDRI